MPHRDLPLHQRVVKLLAAAAEEFGADMAVRLGAALSFYTLFSLVPLLFLIVALVGFVSSDSTVAAPTGDFGAAATDCSDVTTADLPDSPTNALDRMLGQVEDVAGADVADQLAQLTCEAADTAGQALSIGIVLALFTSSTVLFHVQGILNHIFGAPEERTQGLVNVLVQRGIAVAWALVLATLVFVPITAVAAVNVIRNFVPEGLDWLSPLLGVVVPLASIGMLMVVVALSFQLLSRVKMPWQAARWGGMFTAVAALAGAFLVGTYLRLFGGGGTLGAVGGVAVLLFFFNLMWIIYLFGAEVTRVYADYLMYGDVMAPSQRATAAVRDDAVVDTVEEARSAWSASVKAFVIGIVTGWVARRRR